MCLLLIYGIMKMDASNNGNKELPILIKTFYGFYAIRKIWLLRHFAPVSKIRKQEYCKAFGEHLRKLRKRKGITMMDLAHEADIEYSQVAKIERGVTNPTITTVCILADALEIKPIELFRFKFPTEGIS